MGKLMIGSVRLLSVLSVLVAAPGYGDGAKLLAIFPVPFREHQTVYRPLIEQLANRGHDITLLTTDPIEWSPAVTGKRIEQIDLSFVYDLPILEQLNVDGLDGRDTLRNVFDVMRKITAAELQHPGVQELIRSTGHRQYDLVLVEWSGVTLMNAFAEHYRAPLVGISNGGAFVNAHEALGNPNHPIGYPSIFMPFSEDLTLLQRISSVLFTLWYRFYYYAEEIPAQNEIAVANFGPAISDLREIERSADLLLINAYQELGNVRPVGPTTIYLGGLHRRTSSGEERLADDLTQFLAQSVDPVVYVSLVRDAGMSSPGRLEKIIRTLEKRELAIVWSLNDATEMVNTTARIYQSSHSIPQELILAHPKVRLFITDGGQRNIEDAIYHRVPVLGISYSTSYEHYLRQIAKYEAGIVSVIDFETQITFAEKMNDVLQMERYQSNVEQLARVVADQPQTPMERAIWWIEYTARNGGTKHLRGRHLVWFEYLLLDVLLAVGVIATVITSIVGYLFYRAVRYSKSLPTEMVTRGSLKCKKLL